MKYVYARVSTSEASLCRTLPLTRDVQYVQYTSCAELSLDDNLWNALHANALSQKTTVSHLVRERYLGSQAEKLKAMQAFIGIRKEPGGATDAVETVRQLRKGGRQDSRLDHLDRARRR